MTEKIDVYREIAIGEHICEIIKKMYFSDKPWQECHTQVSDKFTKMKKILRLFYGLEKGFLTSDIWEMINKYTEKDIEDVLSMENDFTDKPKEQNKIKKYTDNVVWMPVPVNKPEILEKVRELLK